MNKDKKWEEIKINDIFTLFGVKYFVKNKKIVGDMQLIETNKDAEYIFNRCENDFNWEE